MKVLYIVGSPRKNGNTAAIAEKIIFGAKGGIEFETVFLSDYELKGCLGCSFCQQFIDEMGCFQKDKTLEILNKVILSDLIIYGTPLYGHSYSGQLKLLLDRHVAFMKFISGEENAVMDMEIHSLIKGKPCALIVSCQGPEKDNTELVKKQFDRFCESSLANGFGKYIFPWSKPIISQSSYSNETLQKIICDIENFYT